MIARPDPLVPAEVDLRDFAFMPLDVVRLRDSGLTAKASGDEFRAAVLLWCASWHQQPAASLPNDDEELANLCGYSRAMREWHKIKRGAMRGWIECSDGRLYHPTVAAKARDAWDSKLAQRARTEAARRAREAKRQTLPQALSQSPEKSVTEDVTASKGHGQGQGQGDFKESASALSARARVGAALIASGLDKTTVNTADPRLMALIEQGATPAEFEGVGREAVAKGKGVAWVLVTLAARRTEAAAMAARPGKHAGFQAKDYREGVASDGSFS